MCFPTGDSVSFRGLEILFPVTVPLGHSGPTVWVFQFSKWLLTISRGIHIHNWEISEISPPVFCILLWVQSLGQEDTLEEGMATHSSIFARRILWTEEPGGLKSMGSQRVRHQWSDWARIYTNTFPPSFSPIKIWSQERI